jgi:hypothetical protein
VHGEERERGVVVVVRRAVLIITHMLLVSS